MQQQLKETAVWIGRVQALDGRAGAVDQELEDIAGESGEGEGE